MATVAGVTEETIVTMVTIIDAFRERHVSFLRSHKICVCMYVLLLCKV